MELLPLPASPEVVLDKIIKPGLEFVPAKLRGISGQYMILSIFQQESGLKYRLQQPNGPAKGLGQFERGGGVRGVMNHHASQDMAQAACRSLDIPWDEKTIYGALEFNDYLAVVFARLLLWTDPSPMPGTQDPEYAWQYYKRNWRPGQPHRETWNAYFARAVKAVQG